MIKEMPQHVQSRETLPSKELMLVDQMCYGHGDYEVYQLVASLLTLLSLNQRPLHEILIPSSSTTRSLPSSTMLRWQLLAFTAMLAVCLRSGNAGDLVLTSAELRWICFLWHWQFAA